MKKRNKIFGDSIESFENESEMENDESIVEESNTPYGEDMNDPDRVTVVVANCKHLNVRSAPNGAAQIYATFPEGTKFHLIEDQDIDFYKIVTEQGLIGYAMKDFLRVVE